MEQCFCLTSPSPSTLTNKAGGSWCMAGDLCIIWRPFPRAGSSSSSTGRTSVTQCGEPWGRDPSQTWPSLAVNYPTRKRNSLRKSWNEGCQHQRGFALGWQAWPAFHAFSFYLVTCCHSVNNLEFFSRGFLPCSFSMRITKVGMWDSSHTASMPQTHSLAAGLLYSSWMHKFLLNDNGT